MNLILLESEELGDSHEITLRGRRGEHIRKILKSSPGDTLRVGLLNGPKGVGTILEIAEDRVVVDIALQDRLPPVPATDLILALPRPIMLKRVLSQAAALGVANIYLINASRVEKSFFNSSLLAADSIKKHLISGLEQAADTRLPAVSIHKRFRPFIEDLLPTLPRKHLRIVAHPDAGQTILQVIPRPLTDRILLAIGPEGGWVDYEINKFREQGFSPFSMGPRILRVDTVIPALLSQLDLLRLETATNSPPCHR